MGSGSWSRDAFVNYSRLSKNASVDDKGVLRSNMSNQEMFKARNIDEALDPHGVLRECCDSEEHPNTIPIILALDVTGSMGQASVEVAKKLNVIMTKLYKEVKDVEFMIMGIGDLACDSAPIQVSQFESDIRIAEQLDKVWFEFGGGGNRYESYTAAWYFGLHNTALSCWKRGKKGIIITIGDELPNPYLPKERLERVLGTPVQAHINTPDLYEEATQKFDIYHMDINHNRRYDEQDIYDSWDRLLGDHFVKSNLDNIDNDIVDIILKVTNGPGIKTENAISNEGIRW